MDERKKLKMPIVYKGEASSSRQDLQQAGEVLASILGKELPTENLEIVLACLPYHVLCQFQLVSKEWQRLIAQPERKRLTLRPEFASIRAEARGRAPYILITPKLVPFDPFEDSSLHLDKRRDWHILDTAEKKFYTLSDSFVDVLPRRNFYQDQYRMQFENLGWSRYTMAADGDLIYAVYISSRTGILRHVVCNPVTESYHEIKEPDMEFSYDNIVVMSVEKTTQRYKIITMEAYANARPSPEGVFFYDSAFESKEWIKLCDVLGQGSGGKQFWAYSCTFFEETFYTIFVDLSKIPWCTKLFSCDLESGEWSHINVDLPQPSHPQDKAQLVVCSGRLFFVEHTGLPEEHGSPWENMLSSKVLRRKWQINVTISELLIHGSTSLLNDKVVKKMAESRKYATYLTPMRIRPEDVIGEAVVVLGCGNSIVISTLFGRRAAWNLVEKCWLELPTNPPYLQLTPRRGHRQGLCASIVDF